MTGMATDAEREARKALQCLFIEVPSEVAADVKAKVLAWVEHEVAERKNADAEVDDLRRACLRHAQTIKRLEAENKELRSLRDAVRGVDESPPGMWGERWKALREVFDRVKLAERQGGKP